MRFASVIQVGFSKRRRYKNVLVDGRMARLQ